VLSCMTAGYTAYEWNTDPKLVAFYSVSIIGVSVREVNWVGIHCVLIGLIILPNMC